MKTAKPGVRPDGRAWPQEGGTLDVDEAEGRGLIAAGEAEEAPADTGKPAAQADPAKPGTDTGTPAAGKRAAQADGALDETVALDEADVRDADGPQSRNHPLATGPGNADPEARGPGDTQPGNHPELEPRGQSAPSAESRAATEAVAGDSAARDDGKRTEA